jgi:AcrR family transcriptional regulator
MTLIEKRLPGRPPDEALQERRREAILKMAASTFARHGFSATDVQWIADALRISKGTIYRYFPSKEKLFLAAVERGIFRMQEHVERARRRETDEIEQIRAAVFAYLEFFKKHPDLVELFMQERAEFKGKHPPIYFQHRAARKGPWRERIANLIAAGRIRNVPIDRITDVLGDLMYGTIFTNYMAARQKPLEAQAQDVLDVFFHGILAGEERREGDGKSSAGKLPRGKQ